jgi:DNA invertase Pin-like site-specific DNA recombinase
VRPEGVRCGPKPPGERARGLEFQRELIVEGTREGLAAARARGRTGGRKPKLNARQAATVRRMYAATGPDGKRLHTVAEIAQAVGVHRTTVYAYLKEG